MKVFISCNSNLFALSLQRYLSYIYKYETSFTLLEKTSEEIPVDFYEHDLYINEIFGKKSKIKGIYLAERLEAREKPVIFFFLENRLKSEFNITDLPSNCFYLPSQLNDFLNSIGKNYPEQNKIKILKEMLDYSSLTSEHR